MTAHPTRCFESSKEPRCLRAINRFFTSLRMTFTINFQQSIRRSKFARRIVLRNLSSISVILPTTYPLKYSVPSAKKKQR